jgi:hypothetical protein
LGSACEHEQDDLPHFEQHDVDDTWPLSRWEWR